MNKIFVHCRLPVEELESLKKKFLVKTHASKLKILKVEELLIKAKGVNGVISQGNLIDKNFIKANNGILKVISNVGVGYDNIDVKAATKYGVAVFNTPNLMNHAVADLTMGLILSLVRKICEADKFVRAQKWKGNSWDFFWGESLNMEKLGIIGLGNIGKEFAKRASSFGLKLFYHNRNKLDREEEKKYNVKYLKFDDLITSCKFIVLLLPLSKSSQHMFTKKQFRKMRNDSYIINVARGKIIKEKDLVEALQKKYIAGAGLDVFENEPKIEKKLFKQSNVVFMPHAGSATRSARLNMMKLACKNLEDFFFTGSLKNLVNRDFR